ncbi:hypothetical protein EV401DRAFT_1900065, partial [Pisolithus croceorrhizus]
MSCYPVALLVWDLCRSCELHSERRKYGSQWRHMGGPYRNRHQQGLWQIYSITTPTDPGDDQAHLRRILYDTGANASKYQLWLDARATENRGTPTAVNQATIP